MSSDLVSQEAKYKEILKKYYIMVGGDPTIIPRMEEYATQQLETSKEL